MASSDFVLQQCTGCKHKYVSGIKQVVYVDMVIFTVKPGN